MKKFLAIGDEVVSDYYDEHGWHFALVVVKIDRHMASVAYHGSTEPIMTGPIHTFKQLDECTCKVCTNPMAVC